MMLNMDFVIRLLVAGILGTIIGLDREYRAKEAGYRTHFLVSLGSALIMIVSQYGFQEIIKESSVTLDPSRVAAQVVSGIGFIGAGTIIFQKQIVRGLTTAAGIWATAGIGLAVGAGMYTIGIAATVLTLVGLELLSYLFKSIGMKSSMVSFSTPNKDILKQIADRFNSKDYLIVSYEMETQLDREYRAKEAGYRTHFLVSLGSALIMIVSQYGFQEIIKESSVTLDPSRVAAQVVSGIGFIGAGTIIFQKQIVRGLTTAAGIWATAGIGLAVGAGMYTIGIAATVLTLVGLELLSYLFKSIGMKSSMVSFSTPNKDILKQIADRFNSKDYLIVSYEMETQHTGETEYYQVTMVIKSKRNNDEGHLLSLIQEFPDVTVQRIE